MKEHENDSFREEFASKEPKKVPGFQLVWRQVYLFTIAMVLIDYLVLKLLDYFSYEFPFGQFFVEALVLGFLGTLLLYLCFIRAFKSSIRYYTQLLARLRFAKDSLERKVDQQNEELAEVNEHLSLMLDELEENAAKQELLATMSEMLQSCSNIEESYEIFEEYAHRLCADYSGALWIIASSRNYLELACGWGESTHTSEIFTPDDCWALRRGQYYNSQADTPRTICKHLNLRFNEQCMCIPLNAHGETLALLTLSQKKTGRDKYVESLARQIGDSMAIALSNLRLREKLLNQSIRDSLTKLHNRRYMEEFLDRELKRAERQSGNIVVAMIDVDYFKKFNDTFGHRAGDHALTEVARVLSSQVRESDLVCRYGGEEFAILMPEVDISDVEQRCEFIRKAVESIMIHDDGQKLSKITISMGVAIYPFHGHTHDELIKVADSALYQAKDSGRNQVVVANQK